MADQYANESAEALVERTHREAPWGSTPRNGRISHELMTPYYRAQGADSVGGAGAATGRFLARCLSAQMNDSNRHDLVDWGAPVGQEVW